MQYSIRSGEKRWVRFLRLDRLVRKYRIESQARSSYIEVGSITLDSCRTVQLQYCIVFKCDWWHPVTNTTETVEAMKFRPIVRSKKKLGCCLSSAYSRLCELGHLVNMKLMWYPFFLPSFIVIIWEDWLFWRLSSFCYGDEMPVSRLRRQYRCSYADISSDKIVVMLFRRNR